MQLNKNGYREVAFFPPSTARDQEAAIYETSTCVIAEHEIIINTEATRDIFPFHCQIFATFPIYLHEG